MNSKPSKKKHSKTENSDINNGETVEQHRSEEAVKKKRAKKVKQFDEIDETAHQPPIKKKAKKVKVPPRDNFSDENHLSENDDISKTQKKNISAEPSETIDWPQKDLAELIRRIEKLLPEKDNLAFGTRTEKLDWDNVAFKDYTAAECKRTWLLIQKRIRRFRILSEVLQDAKTWISKPWTNFYGGNKMKRHPDMPRRPLSTYVIFYLKKKDNILKENPGMELTEVSKIIAQMYKNLSDSKREKYTKLAAEERKLYDEKLEEFYRLHPEVQKGAEKSSKSKPEVGPKKPLSPYGLFFEHQLEKLSNQTDLDKHAFKEQCKKQWQEMSDKKKVVWIDWALENETKFLEELKNYISRNPDYVPIPYKQVLTKEEKQLKERIAGKPVKPPNSAYSLFSRMLLQGEDIKKVAPKDRMMEISAQWKNCPEAEKHKYRDHAKHLMEQYKLDFASYLESLPPENREQELQNNLPKRKQKASPEKSEVPPAKKKKTSATSSSTEKEKQIINMADTIFEGEPEQPPVSGFAMFSNNYRGKKSAQDAWNALTAAEKKKFDMTVRNLKQVYIKKYETFLKSLTKEQLTAFYNIKRNNDKQKAEKEMESKPENSSSDTGSSSEDYSSDSSG